MSACPYESCHARNSSIEASRSNNADSYYDGVQPPDETADARREGIRRSEGYVTSAILPAAFAGSSTGGQRGRTIEILDRGPGHLGLRIGGAPWSATGRSAAGRGSEWLVIAENHVPGWSATVDGRSAGILRANGMHMAIEVPRSGTHDVEIRYRPPGMLAGAWISAAVAGFCLLTAFRARRGPASPAVAPAGIAAGCDPA